MVTTEEPMGLDQLYKKALLAYNALCVGQRY